MLLESYRLYRHIDWTSPDIELREYRPAGTTVGVGALVPFDISQKRFVAVVHDFRSRQGYQVKLNEVVFLENDSLQRSYDIPDDRFDAVLSDPKAHVVEVTVTRSDGKYFRLWASGNVVQTDDNREGDDDRMAPDDIAACLSRALGRTVKYLSEPA